MRRDTKRRQRFVCIHGHFYQPPRENPWTGRVERQPSAGEDHDWNCRIARECYAPNARAAVLGDDGKPAAYVNNYAHLSFNFGPTLLSWLETERPEVYQAVLAADRQSARRLGGHGNAIAQAYNHMILPLANARDRATQIRWGLADFQKRFGRKAEALWLPETACDDVVLRDLIDHGLKYAILSPYQAQRVRPLPSSGRAPQDWSEVAASGADPRRPYAWFDGGARPGRSIALFFYDGPVSQEVAFGRLMSDSRRCADRLEKIFDAHEARAQLVPVCTDGETYGHHEKFADLGLAHLFHSELPSRGLPAVNFGYFLSRGAPRWEVELKRGPQLRGTSWSCAHGVGRWMDDCGCGAQDGQHQRWRAPLREALDWLRDRLAEVFERRGEPLLGDVWEARDAYVEALLGAEEDYFARRLRRGGTGPKRQARDLLEMQKFALFMYTSCGWFFSDVAGLEAAQNLKYAARAVELARSSGAESLEAEFVARLRSARGNDPAYPDAGAVYERLASSRSAA